MFEDYTVAHQYPFQGDSIDSITEIEATATNIDFDRIVIPNKSDGTDLFGRTALYSGIAKMNAEWVDSETIDMNPQDVEIGEIAMQFFDMDAYVGNVTGKAEIHPVEIIAQDFYDASNSFYWTSAAFAWVADNVADYPAEYQGFIYWLIKSGQFKNIVAYSPQRSSAENTKINQKGFLPQYTEL